MMGTPLCNSVVSNSFENCLPRYAYPVYEPIQSLKTKELLGKILTVVSLMEIIKQHISNCQSSFILITYSKVSTNRGAHFIICL